MIKGIIIGVLIWQLVVCILHCLEMEDSVLTAPIPFCCMWLVVQISDFCIHIQNIQAYCYLFKIGLNPFKIRISTLLALTEEQKETLLAKTKHQQTRKNLTNLFKKNS
jgi:hypothetical protein